MSTTFLGVAGGGPHLMVIVPHDKGLTSAGNGELLALRTSSPAEVDAFYELALTLGGANEGPLGFLTRACSSSYGPGEKRHGLANTLKQRYRHVQFDRCHLAA